MCFAVPQFAIDLLNYYIFYGTALINAFFDISYKGDIFLPHLPNRIVLQTLTFTSSVAFFTYIRSDDHYEAVLLFLVARGNAARQFR
jgi:hypothetical protein